MKIIDRYVLKQFVQAFVICYLSLTGLYVVFDAFTNLDEFMRYAEKNRTSLLLVLADFYSYRAVFFFDRISGIIVLIAAMFTVAWIRRHNELTALMAAGISGRRVVLPVVAAAVAIALAASASRELLLPAIRVALSRDAKDLLGEVAKALQPRYDHATDVLIRGRSTMANERKIVEPSFVLPDALAYAVKQLSARTAFYHPPEGDRPGGYLFDQLDPSSNLDQVASLELAGRPVVFTPRDYPQWLKPGQCFLVSNVTFEQLTGGRGWRLFSSTPSLVRGLRNPSLDFGADVRMVIHTRAVQPLLDVTLLCLGLPLALSRENRNLFVTIGLCVFLVGAFLLVLLSCQYLGNSYWLNPALAAWIPLLIFVPCAVALGQRVDI